MRGIVWKCELFCKVVWYEVANLVLQWRIRRAWVRMAKVNEELDRVKSEARLSLD